MCVGGGGGRGGGRGGGGGEVRMQPRKLHMFCILVTCYLCWNSGLGSPTRQMALHMKKKKKKVTEKSTECHNHKPQPFPDTKVKGKLIQIYLALPLCASGVWRR